MKGAFGFSLLIALSAFTVATVGLAGDEEAKKDGAPHASAISPGQKGVILSLTACLENGEAVLPYGNAENLEDGNGITFGIAGFSSGAYDGTMVIRRIRELDPQNPLVKYLPAFEAIDEMDHGDDDCCDSTKGLEDFIKDFRKHSRDPKVRQAQMDVLNQQYWNPALAKAKQIGAKHPITVGVLYDAGYTLGHVADAAYKGVRELVADTTAAMGGTPKSGVDERKWLEKFLDIRKSYLFKHEDATMKDLVGRGEMYRRLLKTDNVEFKTPFRITYDSETFTITGEDQ